MSLEVTDIIDIDKVNEEQEIKFAEKENQIENKDDPKSEEIPKEQRNLRTQAYDKSVDDLIRMIREGDIILNSEYQRNYIWDNKKASLLVESIILNIPIPVIYASEEEDSSWNIVDGLQRLSSLKRFFDNNFKLSGLEILQELDGLRYEDLPSKAKRILKNGIIRIILIFNDSHPEIKYDIFMRLNTGSVRLKEQELRNCLFRGSLNDSLKELRKIPKFLQILGLKEPHKRMDDIELILRYFALSKGYDKERVKVNNYKGKLKTFLNNFMNENKSLTEEKLIELKNKFEGTIDKVYSVFGNKAFRKMNEDGSFDTSVNRAIMDYIMISFEKYEPEKITSKKDDILKLFGDLPITNTEFNESITVGTSDTKRIEYRLSTWIEKMDRLMGELDGI
jgi:hypothetical protein